MLCNMTAYLRKQTKSPLVWLLASLTGLYLAASFSAAAHAQAVVNVTGVASYHSSVKVSFAPVPGARDYRMYDVASPNAVKYAGLAHLVPSPTCPGSGCFNHFVAQGDGITPVFPYQVAAGATGGPQVLDVPATEIDWNSVGDGLSHTVVVEAVDALGPVPQGNLYDGNDKGNTPFVNPLPAGAMLGMDKGPTGDGKNSTNGQGPFTNVPHVIAASQPFSVQASRSTLPIPSRPTSTETFLDTFDNAEGATIQQTFRSDTAGDQFGSMGLMKYTMNAGTAKAWDLTYRQANNSDSMPFIGSDHFMDVLFDGGTPGGSAPTHVLYASMAMSPTTTFDITGGKIAHLTMEVDGHQSFRRWVDFQIAPASDPLQGWETPSFAVNNSDHAIFLEFRDGECTLDVYTGPRSPTDLVPTGTAGGSHGARLWGLSGSTDGGAILCDSNAMYVKKNLSASALGLDNKSRYDLFISKTHAAVFQDGQLILQSDIPAGTFPWGDAPMRAYYSHYLYHSEVDAHDDLAHFQVNGQNYCYALNSYWFNDPVNGTAPAQTVCNTSYPAGYGFPFSDERHWDNMGFEVLPASESSPNDFSALAALVQPPQVLPPGGTRPAAPTNVRIIR